ncbi:MAG: co-chaperone DjlA [Gammaproteobacteria bacterium]|nr:co-chaperone DjlA [Gammaproteobacteria bacterium]
MSWWGKVVGGAFGFALGGPIGAMLGAVLGHQFDKGLMLTLANQGGATGSEQERIQTLFFTSVFSVMGHVAKIDGRVSEDEIEMARSIMQQMHLDEQQTQLAIELFHRGKHPDFPLDEVLQQFRRECSRRRNLLQMFIEILLHAAYADGVLHSQEKRLLGHICQQLGFSPAEYYVLENRVRAQRSFHDNGAQQQHYQHSPARPRPDRLQEAYAVLGVEPSANDSDVKRAYRRLMNQHHPDKLVAKGMPEEMMRLATKKTQEIKAAYEAICAARGIK